MNKFFFLIVITVLSSIVLQAQKFTVVVNYVTNDRNSNKNDIYFEPDRALSWNDFKGKPVEGSDAAALTNAGFGIKLAFQSLGNVSQLVMSVYCSFSKKDSWVLPGNKTAYILNHEQRHFDIAFIHTVLFMQNLKNARFTNSNYSQLINKIYSETENALTKTQDQYDTETSNSRIPEKQAEWNEKISKQLALAVKQL